MAEDIMPTEYPQAFYELLTGDYDVRLYPNPVLAEKAEYIDDSEFGVELRLFGQQMLDVMHKNNGLGLAAPQLGLLKRVFVMHPEEFREGLVVCNPVLTLGPNTSFEQEGCLSLPGVFEQVERATEVEMSFEHVDGRPETITLRGMAARIAQHEADHLNGTMFFDRMGRNLRRKLLRAWDEEMKEIARRERVNVAAAVKYPPAIVRPTAEPRVHGIGN